MWVSSRQDKSNSIPKALSALSQKSDLKGAVSLTLNAAKICNEFLVSEYYIFASQLENYSDYQVWDPCVWVDVFEVFDGIKIQNSSTIKFIETT